MRRCLCDCLGFYHCSYPGMARVQGVEPCYLSPWLLMLHHALTPALTGLTPPRTCYGVPPYHNILACCMTTSLALLDLLDMLAAPLFLALVLNPQRLGPLSSAQPSLKTSSLPLVQKSAESSVPNLHRASQGADDALGTLQLPFYRQTLRSAASRVPPRQHHVTGIGHFRP